MKISRTEGSNYLYEVLWMLASHGGLVSALACFVVPVVPALAAVPRPLFSEHLLISGTTMLPSPRLSEFSPELSFHCLLHVCSWATVTIVT